MNTLEALEFVYFQDPCGVLANPLWKSEAILETSQWYMQSDSNGQISHMEAWEDDNLHVYWDSGWEWQPAVSEQVWRRPAFAVINSRFAARLSLTPDYIIQRFFRLQLTHLEEAFNLPSGFNFASVDLPNQASLAAHVIGRSYAHMRPDLDDVIRWMKQPVFDADLWVWIIDQRTGQPAGLGIAEFDRPRREASLEWIQVLPEYRGQGLAKALVTQLLKQCMDDARLVTVSGEADNPSDAEHLYRRCGFSGQDVWWVLRRLGG